MSDPANKKPAQQLDEALERAKIDNELIESFQFDQVQKKSAVFDEKKLLWISQQHLTEMSVRDAMNEIYKLNPDWGDGLDWNYLKEIVKLIKDRSKTITEISEMSELFFQESLEYDQELISKTFKEESVSITKDFKNTLIKIVKIIPIN